MHQRTASSEWWKMNARQRALALWTLGLVLALGASVPSAETITWVNGSGGYWGTPANWDPQDVPDQSGETALVPAGSGTYTIDFNGAVALDQIDFNNSAATLNLNGYTLGLYLPAGLSNSGTIRASNGSSISGLLGQTATGRLLVPSPTNLYLYGDAHNDGTIYLGSLPSVGQVQLYISSYGYTLEGTGALVMQTDGTPSQALLTCYYGDLVQSAGHTIRGSGTIAIQMVNEGRVDADDPGHALVISSFPQVNRGTYAATNSGILSIEGIAVNQSGGGQMLADGGAIRLNNCTVSSGALDTGGSGAIECHGGVYLSDVTNLGQLNIPGSQCIYLTGTTTTDNGTILINSDQSGNDAILYVSGYGLVLDGTGEIRLQTTGSDINDALLASCYGTLVQRAAHTIHGEGMVSVALANEGLVSADVNGRVLGLHLENKSNSGTFQAINGGVLDIAAPVTQAVSGCIRADGGSVHLSNAVTGGRIETTGASTVECYSGMAFSTGTQLARMNILGSGRIADVANQGPIAIVGGADLSLGGGTTTNDSRITVNSNQSSSDAILYVSSYHHILQGSGDVLLQTTGTDLYDACIRSAYGSLIQYPTHTIHGEGILDADFENRGTVNADISGRVLRLGSPNCTNNAICKATNGGVLEVSSTISQGATATLMADGGRVVIDNGCSISGGNLASANGGTVECFGGPTLSGVTNQGQLYIPGGQSAYISNGLTNNGTITINSNHIDTDAILYVSGYGQILSGNGQILLQTTGDVYDARFSSYYASITQAAGHTIRGDGQVDLRLTNYGTIAADVAGRTLFLNGEEKQNHGTMRAQNGGVMNIPVSFSNDGVAEATGGGLLRTGGYLANYQAGTFSGGAWLVRPNSTMRLGGANIQHLGARVLLEGPNANLYSDDGTTPALGPLQAIDEGGDLEFAGGTGFATTGSLAVNFGRLTIGAGSSVTVNGTFTQTGNDEVDEGRTTVNGALVVTGGSLAIDGGTLCGNGAVQGNVTCGGGVAPGTSVGELTIQGGYTQTEDGTYYVELGGPNAGQYDHLQVSGQANLSGRLVVKPAGGYVPQIGQRFTIMNCASRTGEFTLETGCLGPDLGYETYYYADHVEIEIDGAPSAIEEPGEPDVPVAPEVPAPTMLALTARPVAGGGAVLSLDLPQAAEVELSLFDFAGRRVAVLQHGPEGLGRHAYVWEGIPANASGIYLARARVRTADGTTERHARVLLVR